MVEAVRLLLNAANQAVAGVDPDTLELLDLLTPLSPAEQTTLLGVLEREVSARADSLAAQDSAIGPLERTSQLFVRVYAQKPTLAPPTPAAVYRSSAEGLLHIAAFPSHMRASVLAGIADALPALSPTERAAFAHIIRHLIAALEPEIVAKTG